MSTYLNSYRMINLLSSSVHSIMYLYYFAMAANMSYIATPFAPLITTVQASFYSPSNSNPPSQGQGFLGAGLVARICTIRVRVQAESIHATHPIMSITSGKAFRDFPHDRRMMFIIESCGGVVSDTVDDFERWQILILISMLHVGRFCRWQSGAS